MKKKLYFSGVYSLSLLLSACGHEATVKQANNESLNGINEQKLTWSSCDPSLLDAEVRDKYLQTFGNRLQCASYKVPVDWNVPSRGTTSVSLLRVAAAVPTKRQGAIFFNPGGPGEDGLKFGAIQAYLWSTADTSIASGKALFQLSEQFDLVGFAPRGVADSGAITCFSNAQYSPKHYPSADRSQKNIDAMLRNAKLTAEACQRNPFASYINTDQTARDLNLARQLMGESKLNYIGYSYGTTLGNWYARLFPEHTGRLLLDGVTDFASQTPDPALSAMGFERSFREVVLPMTARYPNAYGLGQTADEVYKTYDSFPADLKFALQRFQDDDETFKNLIASMYNKDGIDNIPVELAVAKGIAQLTQQYPDDTAQELIKRFDSYTFAPGDKANELAHKVAPLIANTYFSILREETGKVKEDNSDAVLNIVNCNDSAVNRDPQFWIDLGNKEAKLHPLTGGELTQNACMYWQGPIVSKPAMPAGLPPVLFLQTEDDPATPREGAFKAWKSWSGSKMIFIDNEAQHTSFPYFTDCVDSPIANYFLTGTLPSNNFSVCQATPLNDEEVVYPFGETYTTGMEPQSLGSSTAGIPGDRSQATFGTSVDAQKSQKLLRDILRRNSLKHY